MSLTNEQQKLLLKIANDSIAYGLTHGEALTVNVKNYPEELQGIRATFVTLEIGGQLRGCIGMLEAVQPLVMDVAKNAFLAAFRDPRFPPVSVAEFPNLDIHISILSPSEPMSFKSEDDLISQLRPHEDGLIMKEGGLRGTFLPSVWDSLPDPHQFLQHLKLKTGLPRHYWSDTLQVRRYCCDIISDEL
ncbi:MAG: AmmeMemoRadiSam system protein A [Methylococcales bacterium]|nr:AmmeMemoRadiSam system protein A [Methylococcales bacterium]